MKTNIFYLIFLTITFLPTFLAEQNDCVFIEDCETVYWMLKNMKKIPNKTEDQVSDILK
jgi:hypothetical protein